MDDVETMLGDYRLTTAEIFYHTPEHPELLQTYIWQSLDRVPDFPKLNHFLDVWKQELAGQLHSVRVAYVGGLELADWDDEDAPPTRH